MIRRFEVRNFRMLRSNAISLPAFGVLVGKNATGKTTLLNALRFVSDVLRDGVEKAVAAALEDQGGGFEALCFDRGHPVEFAVDATVTDAAGERVAYRYELSVGPEEGHGIRVLWEFLFRLPSREPASDCQRSLFRDTVSHVVHECSPATWRKIVAKTAKEKTTSATSGRRGTTCSGLASIVRHWDRFPKIRSDSPERSLCATCCATTSRPSNSVPPVCVRRRHPEAPPGFNPMGAISRAPCAR